MVLLLHYLFPEPETRERFVIRWADTLIEQSNNEGILDRYCCGIPWEGDSDPTNKITKFRNKVFSEINASISELDKFTSSFTKYYGELEGFLLKEGYMIKPAPSFDWKLTDKGKLVKELGGHYNYKEHRKREISILKNQNQINTLLTVFAGLAIVVPILVAIFSPNQVILLNRSKDVYELKPASNDTSYILSVPVLKDTGKGKLPEPQIQKSPKKGEN